MSTFSTDDVNNVPVTIDANELSRLRELVARATAERTSLVHQWVMLTSRQRLASLAGGGGGLLTTTLPALLPLPSPPPLLPHNPNRLIVSCRSTDDGGAGEPTIFELHVRCVCRACELDAAARLYLAERDGACYAMHSHVATMRQNQHPHQRAVRVNCATPPSLSCSCLAEHTPLRPDTRQLVRFLAYNARVDPIAGPWRNPRKPPTISLSLSSPLLLIMDISMRHYFWRVNGHAQRDALCVPLALRDRLGSGRTWADAALARRVHSGDSLRAALRRDQLVPPSSPSLPLLSTPPATPAPRPPQARNPSRAVDFKVLARGADALELARRCSGVGQQRQQQLSLQTRIDAMADLTLLDARTRDNRWLALAAYNNYGGDDDDSEAPHLKPVGVFELLSTLRRLLPDKLDGRDYWIFGINRTTTANDSRGRRGGDATMCALLISSADWREARTRSTDTVARFVHLWGTHYYPPAFEMADELAAASAEFGALADQLSDAINVLQPMIQPPARRHPHLLPHHHRQTDDVDDDDDDNDDDDDDSMNGGGGWWRLEHNGFETAYECTGAAFRMLEQAKDAGDTVFVLEQLRLARSYCTRAQDECALHGARLQYHVCNRITALLDRCLEPSSGGLALTAAALSACVATRAFLPLHDNNAPTAVVDNGKAAAASPTRAPSSSRALATWLLWDSVSTAPAICGALLVALKTGAADGGGTSLSPQMQATARYLLAHCSQAQVRLACAIETSTGRNVLLRNRARVPTALDVFECVMAFGAADWPTRRRLCSRIEFVTSRGTRLPTAANHNDETLSSTAPTTTIDTDSGNVPPPLLLYAASATTPSPPRGMRFNWPWLPVLADDDETTLYMLPSELREPLPPNASPLGANALLWPHCFNHLPQSLQQQPPYWFEPAHYETRFSHTGHIRPFADTRVALMCERGLVNWWASSNNEFSAAAHRAIKRMIAVSSFDTMNK